MDPQQIQDNAIDRIERRFGTFELKLDSLSEAVVKIARLDEKIIRTIEATEAINAKLDKEADARTVLANRITELEKAVVGYDVIKRVFWIVVTSVSTGAVGGIGYLLVS